MDSFSRKEIIIGRLKFITMSLIGILLFLVPIPVEQDGQKQTTLPVAFLAGVLKDVLGGVMPFLIVTIITLSGIITLICSTILKDKLKPDGLMNNAFNVRIGWLILRIL
ncbi:TPA: YjiH family protein, partial [Staphylococcus aureus]|nr:YjiH family protein [Staphylococcus aureus]